MSRKTLTSGLCCRGAVGPRFAQQSPPQPGNAPPPSAKADVESAIPLTPGMIRDLGRRVGDNRRAEEEVNTEIASPISRRVNVSFAPGQSTPIVRIVKGYPTALELLRPHGPAVADRVGHQLQSGRTGEQRQLQSGSGRAAAVPPSPAPASTSARPRSARTSCRWPRRLCSRAAGSWSRSRARRSRSRSCWSRAAGTYDADLSGAGGGAWSERQGAGDRPGRARHRFALPDGHARRRAAR